MVKKWNVKEVFKFRKMSYVWDTKEHLKTAKPYGFVEFTDNFFQNYQTKRQRNITNLKDKYIKTDPANTPNLTAIQVQLRFPQYQDPELSKIAQHVSKSQASPQEELFLAYTLRDLKTLSEFNTTKAIRTVYEAFYEGNFNTAYLQHFRKILKKAEVRKLKAAYDYNFKNISKKHVSFEDFGFFALTLALHFAGTNTPERFQSLSTLLKINDFLSSESKSLGNPLELILTYTSLKAEQQFILEIMQERGLK